MRGMNIVDTPGANAVIRRHERLTEEFLPRSDLVLFVTSADRPMTESERQFLERIRLWGKKVIFALNKEDILEDQAALNEVRDFVLKYAEQVIGAKPEFFPVSARLAQLANTEPDSVKRARLREASHIDGLRITSILPWMTERACNSSSPIRSVSPSISSRKRRRLRSSKPRH